VRLYKLYSMSKVKKTKDSAIVPFHLLVSGVLAGGVAQTRVDPTGLGGRVTAEADGWGLFRILSLRFRLVASGTLTAAMTVGFIQGFPDTTPATIADVMTLIPATIQGAKQTVYSNWVSVSKSDLAGAFPWYKAIQGSFDSSEETPGTLCFVGTSTDPFILEVHVTLEFKSSMSTSNTPLQLNLLARIRRERELLAMEREKQKVLRVLQAPVLGAAPTAAVVPTGIRNDLIRPPVAGSEW